MLILGIMYVYNIGVELIVIFILVVMIIVMIWEGHRSSEHFPVHFQSKLFDMEGAMCSLQPTVRREESGPPKVRHHRSAPLDKWVVMRRPPLEKGRMGSALMGSRSCRERSTWHNRMLPPDRLGWRYNINHSNNTNTYNLLLVYIYIYIDIYIYTYIYYSVIIQ